jgi:hypothetical protein
MSILFYSAEPEEGGGETPSCPDSVNAGNMTVYGAISNLCDISGDVWPGTGGSSTRICIPASENVYAGAVEYGHYFQVVLKAVDHDVDISALDMYMRNMDGEVYDVDESTLVQFGGSTISSGIDLALTPVEFLMDGTKDIIFEVTYSTAGEDVPISSDVVSGHSLWDISWPGPTFTELGDSGHRALIVYITEVI